MKLRKKHKSKTDTFDWFSNIYVYINDIYNIYMYMRWRGKEPLKIIDIWCKIDIACNLYIYI